MVQLTGLTSLTILMAEFVYEQDSDLYVFDASPLALCPRLASLLLELHGTKCCQHDLRGLAQLRVGFKRVLRCCWLSLGRSAVAKPWP